MPSSRKPVLVLMPEAEDDLLDIVQYTRETWGMLQAETYTQYLGDALEEVQKIPTIGMRRKSLPPEYRAYQIGQHYIIYRATEDEITVVRILHISRDTPHKLS